MPGSVWHAVTRAGRLIQPDPNLQAQFNTAPSEFYLLGRLLTITYGVLSIPLVYRIGRRAFTRRVGFIGAWFATLSFLPVVYAQMVRTDSAAAFWGALSLLFCLKLYDHPTTKNHVCAGIAIGLGIASRYFLVALIPILFATSVLILLCQTSNRLRTPINWKGMVMGFLAVAFAFALSTPYFFLDSATAREDLSTEARSTHLGADGLSPLGNLRWYLTTAIPLSMSWPQAILAVLGIALIAWHHKPKQLLLLGFSVIFLAGISLLSLHWDRWVIPILPLLALLAANATDAALHYLTRRFQLSQVASTVLAATLILLISILPAYKLIVHNIREAMPSTRVLAREWILHNLSTDSLIAQEWYTAPLEGTNFTITQSFSLAERSLDEYREAGYRYLVVSSGIYERYMAEPDRYRQEVTFYESLFNQGILLQQFDPSVTRGGPTIRIYELN